MTYNYDLSEVASDSESKDEVTESDSEHEM